MLVLAAVLMGALHSAAALSESAPPPEGRQRGFARARCSGCTVCRCYTLPVALTDRPD